MERLQKVMAMAGVASRRKSEEMILEGRVRVNGEVVTQLGSKVDAGKDVIEVDGKPLRFCEPKTYVLLNKPAGFVTTVRDPQGRKKVVDLVRDLPVRLYPVGRLDYDTEGLLILTNDGSLTHALTHPRHEVEKTYLALVQGIVQPDGLRRLRHGVPLEDGVTAPARVRIIQRIAGDTLVELTIHEGKNRQVRRMLGAVGHPVKSLVRTKIGFLTLGELKPGQYRHLTADEVKRLRSLANGFNKKARTSAKRANSGKSSIQHPAGRPPSRIATARER